MARKRSQTFGRLSDPVGLQNILAMEKAENEKPLFRTCVWFNSGRQNLQKLVETWHQSLPKSSAYGPQGRKNGAKMVPTWNQKPSKMGAVRWGTPLPRGQDGEKVRKNKERNKKEGCFQQRPPIFGRNFAPT